MKLPILAATVLLCACAPAAVEDLRGDHAAKRSIVVEGEYQQVYRTVLGQARRCWQNPGHLVVSGDLFTDTRSGTVQVAGSGGVFLAVDVAPAGEQRSRVVIYNALPTWEDPAGTVVEWLRDGSKDCATRPRN